VWIIHIWDINASHLYTGVNHTCDLFVRLSHVYVTSIHPTWNTRVMIMCVSSICVSHPYMIHVFKWFTCATSIHPTWDTRAMIMRASFVCVSHPYIRHRCISLICRQHSYAGFIHMFKPFKCATSMHPTWYTRTSHMCVSFTCVSHPYVWHQRIPLIYRRESNVWCIHISLSCVRHQYIPPNIYAPFICVCHSRVWVIHMCGAFTCVTSMHPTWYTHVISM